MNDDLSERVLRATGAKTARLSERVQSLWSGYGAILRFELSGAAASSVIVKQICPPNDRRHPRGWSSDVASERKLRSYAVERAWYESFAPLCGQECRVAASFHLSSDDDESLFILEDLDAAGYGGRHSTLTPRQMEDCLSWLSGFHARFLNNQGEGLWDNGCYWHLATRPDELLQMRDLELRAAASLIDQRLSGAKFLTLVHGDAKVANFCFADVSGPTSVKGGVAVVDFQYVGRGAGVKDLAYFLSSCLSEGECELEASRWVDYYFERLIRALVAEGRSEAVAQAVEKEWRELYPIAWADFLRFLNGWAPEHYKVHSYSRTMRGLALESLRDLPAESL